MKKTFLYGCLMAVFSLVLAGPQAMATDQAEKAAAETHAGIEKGMKKGTESVASPKQAKEGTAAADDQAAQGAQAVKEEAQKAKEKAED